MSVDQLIYSRARAAVATLPKTRQALALALIVERGITPRLTPVHFDVLRLGYPAWRRESVRYFELVGDCWGECPHCHTESYNMLSIITGKGDDERAWRACLGCGLACPEITVYIDVPNTVDVISYSYVMPAEQEQVKAWQLLNRALARSVQRLTD